jgi:hypothetical protein
MRLSISRQEYALLTKAPRAVGSRPRKCGLEGFTNSPKYQSIDDRSYATLLRNCSGSGYRLVIIDYGEDRTEASELGEGVTLCGGWEEVNLLKLIKRHRKKRSRNRSIVLT